MGHPANFILVDATGRRLYYDHWAADTIGDVLIAGPRSATRYVTAQRVCEERDDEWLEEASAEGGATIDHRARRLVFFGDDLMREIPARRAFLRLLALTWPGWDVRWAYDGLGDVADHAGLGRAAVRRDLGGERTMPEGLLPGGEEDRVAHLVTLRDETGVLTAYPFARADAHSAWQGPELLHRLPEGGLARLRLPAVPGSGLHVDVRTRTADVWTAAAVPGLQPVLAELWPGWRVRFRDDQYEEQMRRCADAVTFPPLDLVAGLDELLTAMARRCGHDPVPALLEPAGRRPGHVGPNLTVELNPLFTAQSPIDPTPAEWSAVLQAATALRGDL
ncbi:hypothetical protein NE236_12485 [Actinoallomurus purpureus]|uniref:hypothetical protein n=1 Tax=Actinoallomurus purpureus TaxID=478114 RepID=UPI002093F149|nr:hypothetical protein [Actinoallomurus purpureus]MCO6005802.1 hypothetical protein [Actinoallomurus purpureus]